MCGRYAFFQRAGEVRQQLEDSNMPVHDCPKDDECRQTYNFPPGAIGMVYRADVPDYGAGPSTKHGRNKSKSDGHNDDEAEVKDEPTDDANAEKPTPSPTHTDIKYRLQPMKWGLVPSWTKRAPDYGSVMRTIIARDDSLAENKGMWNAPKRRKGCTVVAQGFYEWLKKDGGKVKVPHYIKRKDNQLMCMAGLWDCVKYEDSEEKQYTYTIITTDANKQMSWLHDRMPVILDNGSEAIRTWLDPNRYEWSDELQSILKPFEGELEIYPVNKDVGKVGNNSPSFIIPIDSTESKSNIANFFGNQRKLAKDQDARKAMVRAEEDLKTEGPETNVEPGETKETKMEDVNMESNAPLPVEPRGIKRERSDDIDDKVASFPERKILKPTPSPTRPSPAKPSTAKKMKNATSNGSSGKAASPSKAAGSQKITKFFGK